jgi:8-oxo-dGTP diphosphatase
MTEKVKYVVGFCFSSDLSKVALIHKNRPQWQRGRLNGIGGHTEPEETEADAMEREFDEEAGARLKNWKRFAVLVDRDWLVEFFWARGNLSVLSSRTDEQIELVDVDRILLGQSSVLPSLRWLVPMALNDISGVDSCTHFDIYEVQHR